MALDVKVTINKADIPTGIEGFGMPLLFAGMQKSGEGGVSKPEVEYTVCSTLEEVATACGTEDAPLVQAAALLLQQATPPERFAVCGSADSAVNVLPGLWKNPWRQLVLVGGTSGSGNTNEEVANMVEKAGGKVFFASTSAMEDIKKAQAAELSRSYWMYTTSDAVCPAAAVVGATAGKPAGSITYRNQVIAGLEPEDLPDKEANAAGASWKLLHDANGYALVERAGDVVISEGKTALGEYLDVLDGMDWIIANVEYDTQKKLNSMDKVPYDDRGIAQLESVCGSVLLKAFTNGLIGQTDGGQPDYTLSYGLRKDTTIKDRVARHYGEGKFRFRLAGAIHTAEIVGTLEF